MYHPGHELRRINYKFSHIYLLVIDWWFLVIPFHPFLTAAFVNSMRTYLYVNAWTKPSLRACEHLMIDFNRWLEHEAKA